MMLYSRVLVLILSTVFASPVFAMEAPEQDNRAQTNVRPTSPTQQKSLFVSKWEKVRAYAEARIRENEATLKGLKENPEEELKVWYPSTPGVRKNTNLKDPKLTDAFQKGVEADIKFFKSLIKDTPNAFHSSIDELLCSLYNERFILDELSKSRSLSELEKDDRKFYSYALNKLKPFQFGWFEYIEASIVPDKKNSKKFKIYLEKMSDLYSKKISQFRDDFSCIQEEYSLPMRAVSKVLTEIDNSGNTSMKTTSDLLKKSSLFQSQGELSLDNLKELKPLAQAHANSSALFRLYTTPAIIELLNKQYPRQKNIEIDVPHKDKVESKRESETIQTEKQEEKLLKTATLKENSEAQQKNEAVSPSSSFPQTPTEEIEANASTTVTNPETKLSDKSKKTTLQLRQQRKEERKAQQLRAKKWCQEIFEEHLKRGDYSSHRALISDFNWITDLGNPNITMTYESIRNKLENLVKVKNGSGSRRSFFIRNTSSNKPIACYFHEPHPDKAIRIEKWRTNMVEAFKEVGYLVDAT